MQYPKDDKIIILLKSYKMPTTRSRRIFHFVIANITTCLVILVLFKILFIGTGAGIMELILNSESNDDTVIVVT